MNDPKYRMLKEGETIQKNDEYLLCKGTTLEQWIPTNDSGKPVIEGRYRRKIEVSTEKQLADMGEALARLEERHSEVVKEKDNLITKIKNLSNENKKLQHSINARNERIADLEFVIRELRKKAS